MMLKNVMWNLFQDTGRVDAYLFYRNCDEENQDKKLENGMEIEPNLKNS